MVSKSKQLIFQWNKANKSRFDDFYFDSLNEKVKDSLINSGDIYLYGLNKTGKTYLLQSLCNYYSNEGKTSLFIPLKEVKKLGKLNLKVDLISGKKKNNNIDVRTTAISPSNLNFLKKQNLNIKDHQIYNCNEINLFFEKSKNNFTKFINYENNKKDIIHIIENEKLKKILNNKIKKNKNIKTVLKDVVDIDYGKTTILTKKMSYQYDLIVLCVGKNSILIDNYLGKRKIKKNKNDLAYTCIIKHDLDISSASQYFLREGPLAILPINKKSFSLVWSLNNKFKNKSDKEIKILISKRLNRIFLKKNAFKIEYLNNYPIDFKFNKNFYKKI